MDSTAAPESMEKERDELLQLQEQESRRALASDVEGRRTINNEDMEPLPERTSKIQALVLLQKHDSPPSSPEIDDASRQEGGSLGTKLQAIFEQATPGYQTLQGGYGG